MPWTELCPPPPKFICWSSNPPVWLYIEVGPLEEIKVKWGSQDGVLIKWDWWPYSKRKREKSLYKPDEDTDSEHQQSKKRVLPRTQPCCNLISDFQFPELWEINVCCLNQSMVLCYSSLGWILQWGTHDKSHFFLFSSLIPKPCAQPRLPNCGNDATLL